MDPIKLPQPMPDQIEYLERIRAAGEDYDGSYVVGGPRTFWVLEDLRCRKWSPTPQYLHKDAGFRPLDTNGGTGFWFGKMGGGGECQTPDITAARKFPTKDEADQFKAHYGKDLSLYTWATVEHQFINRT